METYERICIADYVVEGNDGKVARVERGKEYLTSTEDNGEVTVFTQYWFKVPSSVFAGEVKFT